jgi:Cu/Ag efflux protein CusF
VNDVLAGHFPLFLQPIHCVTEPEALAEPARKIGERLRLKSTVRKSHVTALEMQTYEHDKLSRAEMPGFAMHFLIPNKTSRDE